MLAGALLVESRSHGVQTFRCMLNAIDQIVRVLAFEALIERERLEAGKADQVGMLDPFRRNSIATEEFSLNLGDLVKVKNDGRRRDIQCRDRAFGRQWLYLAPRIA